MMLRYLRYPEQKGGLVELKDGRLMGIIRGMLKFYSHDRGRSWTEPEAVLADGEQIIGLSDPQGVLRLNSGRIGITYLGPVKPEEIEGATPGPTLEARAKKGLRALFFRTSDDEGETWSKPHFVAGPGVYPPYSLHDALLQLRGGRLLWPFYGGSRAYKPDPRPRTEGLDRAIGHLWYPENCGITRFYYSDDEGETWKVSPDDLMLWVDDGYGNLDSIHETTVAEAKDGRLVALGRCGQMRAAQTVSRDQGVRWSRAELNELCSSNAPIRIRTIPSTGDLMAVWNQVSAQEHRDGLGRCRLSAAISVNNGMTWRSFRNIHVSPGMDDSPRVMDPEPPQFVRPGSATRPGDPRPKNSIEGSLRASYANFWFVGDEVLIEHDYWYKTDPWSSYSVADKFKHLTKNRNRRTSTGHLLSSLPRRLHILPLKWFYEES